MNVTKNFQNPVDRLHNYDPMKGIAYCPCLGHNTMEKNLPIKDAGDKPLGHCFGGHTYEQITGKVLSRVDQMGIKKLRGHKIDQILSKTARHQRRDGNG